MCNSLTTLDLKDYVYWNNRKMFRRDSFQKHEGVLQRIVSEGHVDGNHIFGHKILTVLSPEEIKKQFSFNQKLLDDVPGIK